MSAPAQAALRVEAEARPTRAARLDEARSIVRGAIAAAGEGVHAITFAAPLASVESPLRAVRKGPTWVIAPAEGVGIAAIGATRSRRLRGEDRIAEAREACSAMLDGLRARTEGDALTVPVRALVGLSFAPGSSAQPPWDAFGDGLVSLPRWTYATDGARASITLTIDRERPLDERLAAAELEAIWGGLEADHAPRPTPAIVRVDHLDRERWDRAIESIGGLIARGEARKIVASRRAIVTTATDLDPVEVLARLADPRAPTTRFLVRVGAASFVGATPEHLFVQRGARIATEALAGSIAAGAEAAAQRLLESAKDRDEHALVVRHIALRLAPLCTRVAHPDAPQIRRLPSVLHLRTPIEAELARATHPLDVVAALHPTPAVGGTPDARALEWITRCEPAPRGWYGAPLGWVDARGDAEMLVALRCGVVQGGRAWLYAGGGIVAGSSPGGEWDETSLKLRPMLRAIGAHA